MRLGWHAVDLQKSDQSPTQFAQEEDVVISSAAVWCRHDESVHTYTYYIYY